MKGKEYTCETRVIPGSKEGELTRAIRVEKHDDVIFHHVRGVNMNYITGPIADKLYAYENLGYSPEELKKIIRELRVRRDVANTVYGKSELDRMKAIHEYMCNDISTTVGLFDTLNELVNKEHEYFAIERVIFHNPATIVFWADGSKTVVKCTNEAYDPEKGLAMAISKRALGDKGNYYEVFKKHLKKEQKK